MKLYFRIGNWFLFVIEFIYDFGLEFQRLVLQIWWYWLLELWNEGLEYMDYVVFINCRFGNYLLFLCCCFCYLSLYCFNGGLKLRCGSLFFIWFVIVFYVFFKCDFLFVCVFGVNVCSFVSVFFIVCFLLW